MSSASLTAHPEQRFLLDTVHWQTYEALLTERNGRRYRITYDRGRLELMTLSLRLGLPPPLALLVCLGRQLRVRQILAGLCETKEGEQQ